jgi:HK97 family phage prohead protease
MDMEQKFIALETEFKSESSSDDSMTFSGYGAYFNNVDSYGDVILPGAFKDNVSRAKKGDFPVMLSQHGMDDYTPVGVFTKIVEDEKGLYVEGKLANTTMGRDLYELMKMTPRPAIKGMSIGYRVTEAEYPAGKNDSKFPKGCYRKIKAADVLEISIVTFPANKKATITNVKSEFVIRDAEKALREAGYSANEAKTIISIIKNANPVTDELPEVDEEKKLNTEQQTPELMETELKNPEVEAKEDEISEEMKGLLSFLKDLHDPRSAGLELNEEQKSELETWVAEQKKQSQLHELRDFLKQL